MSRSNSAKALNKEWSINAHHALQRASGEITSSREKYDKFEWKTL